MLVPTDVFHSENFTASLSDDPSGIWYLDISCKTEKNGVKGVVKGHIPLCLQLKENPDGTSEAVLSVMDEPEDDGTTDGNDNDSNVIQFHR